MQSITSADRRQAVVTKNDRYIGNTPPPMPATCNSNHASWCVLLACYYDCKQLSQHVLIRTHMSC